VILSNTKIVEAMNDGRLEIDPAPRVDQLGDLESAFDTSAVDLRLGPLLAIPKTLPGVEVNLRTGGTPETLAALSDEWDMAARGPYTLQPGQFVLGQTLERVHLRLPMELTGEATSRPVLAARVEGKSSRARFGLLVHFTAPTIHAGFSGRITLEMICLGGAPLILSPGVPICQLVIEQVDGAPTEGPSRFQGQSRPSGLQI
jgi:dCTP deaminase